MAFFHAQLRYGGTQHLWWNITRDSVLTDLLSPYVNKQIILVNHRGGKALLNMNTVDSLRIFCTPNELSEGPDKVPQELTDDAFLNAVDCTLEFVEEVMRLRAAPNLTSLLQKSFAPPRPQVFVIMQFGDRALDSAYQGVIKPVVKSFGLEPIRIDEVQDAGKITDQVLEALAVSKYVLADLSGERPNCYYESGFAHALGKSMILSIRKGDAIHFDLAGHRFIVWETENDLRQGLKGRFEALEKAARVTDDTSVG